MGRTQAAVTCAVALFACLLAQGVLAGGHAAATQSAGSAELVAVHDGDTLTIRQGRTERRVRLEGVDAPELGQPFSNVSRQTLLRLLKGNAISVMETGQDRYGRTLARVTANGTDVSLAMVRLGMAWHFVRYSDDTALAEAERTARGERVGLWSEKKPVAPWDYRDRGARPTSIWFAGNVRSKVYHSGKCRHYSCENCTVLFRTKDEARKAGFRPHRDCTD